MSDSGNGNGNGATPTPESAGGNVETIEIQEEMEQSFIDYAMSVIVARALPDVRDGLKPVHRRILWAMHDANVTPDRSHTKCATVVGDVIGHYHPHGDQAVYDALVRMGQHFSLRHQLIDPHGNFGSPSDPPAAYRYCVTGDSMVRMADGSTQPISTVAAVSADAEIDLDLKVLGRSGEPVRATRLFHSGDHAVLRLRTREGFELTGTENHPVLCIEAVAGVPMLQWKLLDEIAPGDRVAICRQPALESEVLTDSEYNLAFLAGAMVAEGFVSSRRAGFNNTDREYFEQFVEAYDDVVGGSRYVYERVIASGSRLHELDVQNLAKLRQTPLAELQGLRSAERAIPSFVWSRGPAFKRAFLQALYEGDGSVTSLPRNTIHVVYSSRSHRLVTDIQKLLLEFGVIARLVGPTPQGEYKLYISNRRDARLFATRVGFWGRKQVKLRAKLLPIPSTSRALSRDEIPFIAAYIRSEAGRGGLEWLKKRNIDRVERWERDGDEIWSKIANPEVRSVVEPIVDAGYFYATVDTVESAGTQAVYSLRVDSDDHSFLTNGFVSHNTECRLSRIATHLLANIDEDTVDFIPNFDGKHEQPTVLPARYPNLLVNGSQGIAVGMATNIPPHNLGEVIDATTHLIDNPEANVVDLMQFVKAPDFPTGGLILGQQGSIDAFMTGRGSIKLRAVAEIEETKRGTRIVVTEIPYQTSVEAIEQKIADLVDRKEIQGLREIRNESAHGNTKLVIELKKDAPALVILNNLYKHTPLQITFAVNMVALDDGVPRTLNLRDALRAYIDHQVDVITRRTQFRLDKAKARAHIVEGLVKALGMIDKIIAAIRKAKDRAAALASLTNKTFGFTEIQANHILDMQLHRLTQLGRQNLEAELKELRKTIRELSSILNDQGKLMGVIKTEMAEIREKYAEPRRTPVTFDSGDINIEDLIDDEDLVVTLTAKGYVKTVSVDAFRTQGRGGRGVAGAKLRDEDYVTNFISTTAHAYLLFFSNQGKVYRLKAHEIPMKERTARGTAIPNLLQLAPDEKIQAIIDTRDYETNRFLFFVTRNGQVKKTKFTEYDSARSGLRAINLKDGDELVKVLPTNGEDDIFVVSQRGQAIRFSEADVRPMGRGTAGVRGMKLRAGDEVVSCDIVYDDCALLTVTDGGYGKRTQLDRFNTQGRGGMGVRAMKIVDKKGEVVASFMVHVDEEIFVIATGGVVIRMPVKEISSQGRDATGVKVMNLEKNQRVAAVAPVLQADDDESAEA